VIEEFDIANWILPCERRRMFSIEPPVDSAETRQPRSPWASLTTSQIALPTV